MKKLIATIGIITLLTACSEETTKTVVVDQNGNVIEEKVEGENRFVTSGKILANGAMADMLVLTDTQTGCEYLWFRQGISPLYDENGNIKGCNSLYNKRK